MNSFFLKYLLSFVIGSVFICIVAALRMAIDRYRLRIEDLLMVPIDVFYAHTETWRDSWCVKIIATLFVIPIIGAAVLILFGYKLW